MQSTTYGNSRIGALAVSDCDRTAKHLKFTMSLTLILTILTAFIIIACSVYNHYKTVDTAENTEEILHKKKLIDIGTYGSMLTSLLTVAAVMYAIPNVNKVISCPPVQ